MHRDVFRFFRLMIALRKAHPTIARSRYWRDDIRWYGMGPDIDMSHTSRHLAFYLDGRSQRDADFCVMINGDDEGRVFNIQKFQPQRWVRVVDTARKSPEDICEPGDEVPIVNSRYAVGPRSIVVLMCPRRC